MVVALSTAALAGLAADGEAGTTQAAAATGRWQLWARRMWPALSADQVAALTGADPG